LRETDSSLSSKYFIESQEALKMRTIAQGAIRILTILFLLQSIAFLMNYVIGIISYYSYDSSGWWNISFELFSIIIILIVAGLIVFLGWWKSDKIAKILVGELKEEPLVINTSNDELIKLVLSIFGIFLFVTSIADIGGLAAYHMRILGDERISSSLGPEAGLNQIKQWVIAFITLLFGILLMGKGRRIGLLFANLWKYGSLIKPPEEEEND
jgi:hypothetical protein